MNFKPRMFRGPGAQLGWRRVAACVLAALVGLPALAQTTNSARRLDYSAFRIIADRNIFNTRRYARVAGQPERREDRRASRVESVALVGTMIYDKGPLAFFDGSRSDYRKVLKPADHIAGFEVVEIAPTEVKLAAGTNAFELRVGRQLQREEAGEWKVAERPETPVVAYSPPPQIRVTAAPTASPEGPISLPPDGEPQVVILDGGVAGLLPPPEGGGTNTLSDAAAGGAESDILRRLMQRREQEMN